MIARTYTCSLLGIDALLVEVEVDLSPGLPAFATAGLPYNSVRKSKDRVKTVFKNSGYPFPMEHITVNLGQPISRRKEQGLICPSRSGFWRPWVCSTGKWPNR
jgi:magnesium chelatase family protein